MYKAPTKGEIITTALMGAGVLGVTVLVHWEGRLGTAMLWGFLLGMLGGFSSAILLAVSERSTNKGLLRMLAAGSGPFGALLLLPVTSSLAAGYFAGAGVTFCFSESMAAVTLYLLIRDQDDRRSDADLE